MSFYDEIKEMTEQGKRNNFNIALHMAKQKVIEAAKAGKTETIFYGDYDYTTLERIKAIFEKGGFKCYVEPSSSGSWRTIFNWE